MMAWRNVNQLNSRIIASLPVLRQLGAQCIIGIPRSGTLAGSIMALHLGLPISDPVSFASGRAWWRNKTIEPRCKRVLLVDDSLNSGKAMRAARKTTGTTCEVLRLAVYGRSTSVEVGNADMVLEAIDGPRVWEWNLFKHRVLETSISDIDGVLCRDPLATENDDGEKYRRFIEDVPPLYLPRRPLGWICTTRLEKYRAATEAWLAKHGIRYRGLLMLDLPTAEARRRSGKRAEFKAAVYGKIPQATVFIESDRRQAAGIANLTKRPVICMESRELFAA